MRIIAGDWGGRRIKAPAGREVRPTTDRVREAWMAALGGRLDGLTVLDLFAGSGALGLEALSRGAAYATFVELARASLRSLEDNVRLLEAGDRCRIVRGDAMKFVRQLGPKSFDLALADPPYQEGWAAALLERFCEVPFARELWVEHRTGEPLPELPGLAHRRYGDTMLTIIKAE
ncbi:MAG: 16S rRNA (guanine(966)-N(2))-methyltransferase RsmD [Gemmatimonadetes bacterium]|nr:16S rRNA (guanine(966)-N(2))-methyltransferase RsmD [Gemmatimonadota bacterium]